MSLIENDKELQAKLEQLEADFMEIGETLQRVINAKGNDPAMLVYLVPVVAYLNSLSSIANVTVQMLGGLEQAVENGLAEAIAVEALQALKTAMFPLLDSCVDGAKAQLEAADKAPPSGNDEPPMPGGLGFDIFPG